MKDRLFIVLTLNVAAAWFWGTQQVAEHVGTANSARLIGAMMTGFSSDPEPDASGSPAAKSADHQLRSPQERGEMIRTLKRQLVAVESVVIVWRRGMWSIAAFLDVVAVVSVITGRMRPLHLVAAAVICLSTVGTFVGMYLLIDPGFGGLPPQPTWMWCAVGATQSAYGLVLLIAYARPRKSSPRTGLSHGSPIG